MFWPRVLLFYNDFHLYFSIVPQCNHKSVKLAGYIMLKMQYEGNLKQPIELIESNHVAASLYSACSNCGELALCDLALCELEPTGWTNQKYTISLIHDDVICICMASAERVGKWIEGQGRPQGVRGKLPRPRNQKNCCRQKVLFSRGL